MSKDTYYFSHDYNARNDRKLINLIMQHGMIGIGVFWCIVEMMYEEGGYLPLEYERITFELRTDTDVIRSVIHDFELFKIDGNRFYSDTVLKRLESRREKSEKARKSINYRWEKYKDTNVLRTNKKRNTIKERKGKEKKGKNKYLDCVFLSADEVIKLKEKLGNGDFDKAVEILNNYKQSSGKKYQSDYHAMLTWVIKRIEEKRDCSQKDIWDTIK